MNGKIKEHLVKGGKVIRVVLQCQERDFEVFKIIAAARLQEEYGQKLDFSQTEFLLEKLQ